MHLILKHQQLDSTTVKKVLKKLRKKKMQFAISPTLPFDCKLILNGWGPT